MSRKRAGRESTAARRHAGHGVLLACALVWGATGTVYAETTSRQDGKTPLQPDSEGRQLLAQASGKPGSRDSLFADDPPADKPKADPAGKPPTRDSLFADDKPAAEASRTSPWRGYIEGSTARAYREPEHWSKARLRADVTRQGQFSENVKWKIGARADYDGVYDHSNFYAPEVRRDQRYEFVLRENYLDISTGGNWEFRLGRQHVVWGELVGAFVADVVSARDLREFILLEPDLQSLRIPQWAVRAEYFGADMKAEVLWIPYPSYDDIGKPGIPGVKGAAPADFFPFPFPGPGGIQFRGEDRPTRKLSNTNFGGRLSALKEGWDFSGFYYHSMDVSPTFYRQVVPGPAPNLPVFLYQARHDKIDQFGGTVAKDLGFAVLKGEGTYTTGRSWSVTRVTQPGGVVALDTFDWAASLDFTLPKDARLNVQLFQRVWVDHDPDILQDKHESILSAVLDFKFAANWEGRLLAAHSLNRSDWLVRPKVTWLFEKNWRFAFGVDIFGGPVTGVFGRFDNNDRAWAEMRYSF